MGLKSTEDREGITPRALRAAPAGSLALFLALSFVPVFSAGAASASAEGLGPPLESGRTQLKGSFLMGRADLVFPVDTPAFAPPASPPKPRNRLRGRITMDGPAVEGEAIPLRDDNGVLANAALQVLNLPPLDLELVQSGNDIIPMVRGSQVSSHPYWEWIFEPGRVWDEADDRGFSRVSMPFSLQQRNQNCTHHGMLTFLFHDDGRASRMAWQVVSETCLYFQADLWGMQKIRYAPGPVENAAAAIARYRQDVAARMPVKSVAALTFDYPGILQSGLRPQAPQFTTIYGLVSDGTHYIGGCATRYGPYPFCNQLSLPSYATAKSVFAGLAYMYLKRLYPTIGNEGVAKWVPECVLPDTRWTGVDLRHVINMTTGLYTSQNYMVDENALVATAFIQVETHAAKADFACTEYTRRRPPGEWWVNHSSDTYLAGEVMDGLVGLLYGEGAETFTDILVTEIWQPLRLSAVTETTRRTYDAKAQPFAGYGLTFLPDDVARIGRFLNMD
ncbi:MAG: hypothetical protein R3212_08005, partial [Xanthomonadales bacterium]|nr:hypothetical protein [Xanthomonadales bacterium]